MGTEEWGNLSDDLGNGSGSGSEEDVYSSSDESLPGSRLLSSVVQCGTVQCYAVQCSAMQCSVVQCRLLVQISLLCPIPCSS